MTSPANEPLTIRRRHFLRPLIERNKAVICVTDNDDDKQAADNNNRNDNDDYDGDNKQKKMVMGKFCNTLLLLIISFTFLVICLPFCKQHKTYCRYISEMRFDIFLVTYLGKALPYVIN